jgi:hypothetical protein
MIDQSELGSWADDLDRELNRFSGFTGNLAHTLKESLSSCVTALNVTFADDRVGKRVNVLPEDALSVRFRDPRFGDRILRIVIDASVNEIYYTIFNDSLCQLSEIHFVPEATTLKISANGIIHKIFKQDDTEFTNTYFSNDWSTVDQLATYLLQQLIVPTFIDHRFRTNR